MGYDPQQTIEQTVEKYEKRISTVKEIAHLQGYTTLQGEKHNILMDFWNKAKEATK
ncbi:hypothetical protein [Rickettsiales endosymbiont of Stachyamoeba lipophora]|uniref:hypothetical protein n=1 Tax=Rickettsiales endosymbiont of Stachyamoeba lipophora TaxID=2486578 RepID=UPI0013DE1D8B|nr:hypothetical protein [Rickettsiales endosymbiont of Stachyamoeba lipophora]